MKGIIVAATSYHAGDLTRVIAVASIKRYYDADTALKTAIA